MKSGTALLAAAYLALTGCTERPDTGKATASDAVKAADASFQQAIASKDLNKIMSFYADDAVLMPAAKPLLTGKAAIMDEWNELLAIPAFQNASKLQDVEVSASNDLAYTRGSYHSADGGRRHTREGAHPISAASRAKRASHPIVTAKIWSPGHF